MSSSACAPSMVLMILAERCFMSNFEPVCALILFRSTNVAVLARVLAALVGPQRRCTVIDVHSAPVVVGHAVQLDHDERVQCAPALGPVVRALAQALDDKGAEIQPVHSCSVLPKPLGKLLGTEGGAFGASDWCWLGGAGRRRFGEGKLMSSGGCAFRARRRRERGRFTWLFAGGRIGSKRRADTF